MNEIVLECTGLSRFFGGVRALHRASLALRAGEICCLVGDNGAGKSTLANIISGKYRPDEGSIIVNGQSHSGYSIRLAQQLGIQTVHQHLALCNKLTAAENIVLGAEPLSFALGPIRIVNRREAERLAAEQVAEVGGRIPSIDVPVEKFSGGQRQAIAIARAVFRARRLVILDEPTAALGVRQTAATLEIIRRVAKRGLAVMVISHNLNDVYQVADRIVALRLGEIVLNTTPSQITPQDLRTHMAGIELAGFK